MSKNNYLSFSVLLISTVLITNSSAYAAQADEQQALSEEHSEVLRKRKPDIAERDGIRASLKALRSNGALQRATQQSNNVSTTRTLQNTQLVSDETAEDLISIKHVLTCETEANCQTAVEWGNNNNFSASGVLTSEGHGGEVMYHLLLRQVVSPDEDIITSESSRVHEGAKSLAGIRYATWMVDFDPNGVDPNGVNQ